MGKPNYRVVVSFDAVRTVFTARTPELDHLSGEGPTRAAAMGKLEEEIDAQLANMLSLGTTPPRAVDEIEHSGEVMAKISRGLHRDLAYLAGTEGVEINQIVSELLASALAMRQGGRPGQRAPKSAPGELSDDIGNRADGNRGDRSDGNRSDGNRRGFGGRGHNPQIMDDRANFIEYVRGLETNPGAANQGRPHGGGHGGPGGHRGGGGGGGGDNRRRRGRGGSGGGQQQGGGRDQNRMQGGRGPGGMPQGGQQQGGGNPKAMSSAAPASNPPSSTAGSEPQE